MHLITVSKIGIANVSSIWCVRRSIFLQIMAIVFVEYYKKKSKFAVYLVGAFTISIQHPPSTDYEGSDQSTINILGRINGRMIQPADAVGVIFARTGPLWYLPMVHVCLTWWYRIVSSEGTAILILCSFVGLVVK